METSYRLHQFIAGTDYMVDPSAPYWLRVGNRVLRFASYTSQVAAAKYHAFRYGIVWALFIQEAAKSESPKPEAKPQAEEKAPDYLTLESLKALLPLHNWHQVQSVPVVLDVPKVKAAFLSKSQHGSIRLGVFFDNGTKFGKPAKQYPEMAQCELSGEGTTDLTPAKFEAIMQALRAQSPK